MISNSEGWVYIHRNNEREGLVRQWEKDCWGILTKKGGDYNHFLNLISIYFDTTKAVLVPGGAKVAYIDSTNLGKDRAIEKINEKLYQQALFISISKKQPVENSKIVVTPKKNDSKKSARVIPVPRDRTFTTDEWDAMNRFFNGRKFSDVQYRLNTEFFPSTVEIRFMEQQYYPVFIDLKNPETMVVQIEEIFERIDAPYEVSLVLEDIMAPTVTMRGSQQNSEVA